MSHGVPRHGSVPAAPLDPDAPPSPPRREAPRPEPAWMRAVGALSAACGAIAAAMIVASVLVTCQMIFVRFVLGRSTIWQTEAVVYMMIGATLIGLPYVQRLRGHVNVDLIPLMLPRAARRVLALVTLAFTLAIVGVMAWHGWHLFAIAWERGWRSDTVWGVPLWIPYLAMPVGFGLFAVQLAADLFGVAFEREAPFEEPAHEPPRGEDA